VAGAPVRIGPSEFDWQPQLFADEEFVPGNRGTDYRLEDPDNRPRANERKAARKARRVPYELTEAHDGAEEAADHG
jgi:GTPase